MKVRATIDWNIYKLVDRETGKARTKGEIFEVSKKRYEELTNNIYTKVGYQLVEVVEKAKKD